jgi:hypothetical protein
MNSYQVVRTFHPIGQGAFYTERHESFNVVYDCGAMPLSNNSKSIVSSAFSKNDDIDILFISHFDYDHVSAISMLVKSVSSIKTVVLPVLDIEEKNLLINVNRVLSLSILSLIKNPQGFFGPDTKIIYIKSANDFEDVNSNDQFINLSDFPYNNLKNTTINSGTELRLGGHFNWMFVPYNFKHKDRQKQLVQKLTCAGFDINKMRNDPSYSLCGLTTSTDRKKLRQIYSQINGSVNENSMLVYSGPSSLTEDCCSCFCQEKDCCPIDSIFEAGCIFTGDCDLNKVNIQQAYSKFIKHVGTIQIPHHGSQHSFDLLAFTGGRSTLFCPVSFGTKNIYGHPSPEVINLLSLNGFRPLFVNELPESKYEQKIKMYNKSALKIRKIVGCI